MAINAIYTGVDLFNVLTSNNTVELSYSNPYTTVTVPLGQISGAGTPGVRIDGFNIIANRVYRLSVTGYAPSGIQANLWAAKNASSRNLLDPVPSLSEENIEVEVTGEFTFASAVDLTCFVGVLVKNAKPGDFFKLTRIQLQLLEGDYIAPFGIVETQPTFQSVQVNSDLVVNGISVADTNNNLAAIIATDASLTNAIAQILVNTSAIITDVAVAAGRTAQFTSDLAALRQTDLSTTTRIHGLWQTDSSLSSDLRAIETMMSDVSLSVASDVQVLLSRIHQYSEDITAIEATDIVIVGNLLNLTATDVSLGNAVVSLNVGQIIILSNLIAHMTTDASIQSSVSVLQSTDTDLTNLSTTVLSKITALQTTDTSMINRLTSDIAAMTTTDTYIENIILSFWTTDAMISSDLDALQATDTAIFNAVNVLWTTDAYIISQIGSDLGDSSDVIALQTTEAFIGSEIAAITTTDIALGIMIDRIVTTDLFINTTMIALESDIAALWTTDVAIQSDLSASRVEINVILSGSSDLNLPITGLINGIWMSDATMDISISALTTSIANNLTSDALLQSDIARTQASDAAIASDLQSIQATNTSFFSDFKAIWTTESYILTHLGGAPDNQLFTTDASFASDLVAIMTTDVHLMSDIAAIWATDATIVNTTGSLNSDFATLGTVTGIESYRSGKTYVIGNRVYYKGRVFQATGATSTQPIDYLFYDDLTGFSDTTILAGGLYGYTSNNNFAGTSFTGNNTQVGTSSDVAGIIASLGGCLSIDPGVVDMTIDISFRTLPLYNSANPWFCFTTPSNGVLTFVPGTTANDTLNPTTRFAIGGGGTGLLSGGASATGAIISGAYSPPVSGDMLRLTRTATTITLKVKHNGSFGGTGVITMIGASFTTANTTIQIGLGSGGTYFVSKLAIYANAATEDAKLWSLVQQPISRKHVISNALTLNARYGRFFWNPGSLPADTGTSIMTWTNSYITPQAGIRLKVTQWGLTTVFDNNVSLTVCVVGQGQGKAKLQLANGGGVSSLDPHVAVSFYIDYPVALS